MRAWSPLLFFVAFACGPAAAPAPAVTVEAPPPRASASAPPSLSLADRCEQKVAEACVALADGLPTDSPASKAKAADLYHRACDLGDAVGCWRDGAHLYDQGDKVEGLQRLNAACDAANARACHMLATLYFEGLAPGSHYKDARGADYMKRACDANDAESCLYYGDFLEQGSGVAKDAAAAKTYFQRACTMGDSRGCAK